MNIRKQYTKPNCTLVLDGFDENASGAEESIDLQEACISIITSAECHFTASNQKISGGRTFLENLASAVSSYAQELLSGLSHPQDNQKDYPQVQIALETSESADVHRITLEPNPQEAASKQEIALRTVELFDLVEAIDRFYADTKTLPDVALKLEVVSKRFRQAEEPLAQRAVPLVAGVLSLAVAAGFFFMLPIPEPRQPEPLLETSPIESVPDTPESDIPPSEPEATEEE